MKCLFSYLMKLLNMKSINIVSPANCSKEKIEAFYKIILKGGQINVSEQVLKENINNCLLLGFCEIKGEIAGIAAVKVPRASYKKGVFEKANVSSDGKLFDFEIGY